MNSTAMLYAAVAFVLGAVVALGGEHLFFKQHDPRDAMQTIAAFQDWQLTCGPRTNPKSGCALEERIVQKGTNNTVADLTVVRRDNKDMLSVVAPLGVNVQPGMRLVVGQGSPISLLYKTCLQWGCIADMPIDSNLAQALSQSTGGQITIATVDGKAVPLNFSLSGYKDALAARAVDTAARAK